MAESPARRRRQPQLKLPGPLAATLRQVLDERGLSARGLSLAAGLAGDTVRNALSGRSRTTRPEALEALAAYLGVSVAALQGREPLPPLPAPGAPHVSSGSARVPEMEYVPRGETPHPAADLERREVGAWVLPIGMLAEGGGTAGGLAIVRAPNPLGDIRRGDRLLVDAADTSPSPPGVLLLWDGWSASISHCSVSRSGGEGLVRMQGDGAAFGARLEDVEVLGRVVGRWAWM